MKLNLIIKQVDALNHRIARVSIAFLYIWGVALAFFTSFRGPQYYANWGYEHSLFTFGSSLQYFTAGLTAFLCFWIARYLKRSGTAGIRRPWLWLTAAFAFGCAAVDEMMAFHEPLLERFGQSHTWFQRFYFHAADDVFLIGLGIGALLFSAIFMREIKPVKASLRFYSLGIFLLLLAGLIDYLPPNLLQQKLPLGTEELSEYFAGASFAASFLLYFIDRAGHALINWLAVAEPETVPAVELLGN